MSISISETQTETIGALPPLPTAETIANGILKKKENPAWLDKPDKFALFEAVEGLITAGHAANTIFAAIGINRGLYYERIWFGDAEAQKFRKQQEADRQKAEPHDSEAESLDGKKKRPKTSGSAESKLAAIEQVSRLRYVEGHDFVEACRLVRISPQKFYDWSQERSRLQRIVEKKQKHANGQPPTSKRHRYLPEEGDTLPEDVVAETLEQKKEIVEQVHALTIKGLELRHAARKTGIRAADYHKWVREIDREVKERKNPLTLWQTYKAGGSDGNRQRLI